MRRAGDKFALDQNSLAASLPHETSMNTGNFIVSVWLHPTTNQLFWGRLDRSHVLMAGPEKSNNKNTRD